MRCLIKHGMTLTVVYAEMLECVKETAQGIDKDQKVLKNRTRSSLNPHTRRNAARNVISNFFPYFLMVRLFITGNKYLWRLLEVSTWPCLLRVSLSKITVKLECFWYQIKRALYWHPIKSTIMIFAHVIVKLNTSFREPLRIGRLRRMLSNEKLNARRSLWHVYFSKRSHIMLSCLLNSICYSICIDRIVTSTLESFETFHFLEHNSVHRDVYIASKNVAGWKLTYRNMKPEFFSLLFKKILEKHKLYYLTAETLVANINYPHYCTVVAYLSPYCGTFGVRTGFVNSLLPVNTGPYFPSTWTTKISNFCAYKVNLNRHSALTVTKPTV